MNSRQENVFVWNKKYGETLAETRERFLLFHPELRGKKVSYEGRLDPLAEGIILFVLGDADREALRNLDKEYELDMLFGFHSDSFDILGLVDKFSYFDESIDVLEKKMKEFNTHYFSRERLIPIPLFSSPHIRDMQKGREIQERRKKHMSFSQFQILSREEKSVSELQGMIAKTIHLVRGDFRQDEIMQRWDEVFASLQEETMKGKKFPIIKIRMETNSGAYVRSYLDTLSTELGVPIISLKIRRIRMGPYILE